MEAHLHFQDRRATSKPLAEFTTQELPSEALVLLQSRALAPLSDLRGKRGHEEDPRCLQEQMPGKWGPTQKRGSVLFLDK